MMKIRVILFLSILFFSQCTLFVKKEKYQAPARTPEELWSEKKAKQDSIDNLVFKKMEKTAFGDYMFGMNRTQVQELNVENEQLGKYNFSILPSFDENNELYKLSLKSSGVKALKFETDLLGRYTNLFKIIEIRYGTPVTQKKFPSIFDVQESKKYLMSKWEKGRKTIVISLIENNLNSYAVVCDIFDATVSISETDRFKKLKNKDIIESADKF